MEVQQVDLQIIRSYKEWTTAAAEEKNTSAQNSCRDLMEEVITDLQE